MKSMEWVFLILNDGGTQFGDFVFYIFISRLATRHGTHVWSV